MHGALEHLLGHPFGIRRQRTELVVINRRGGNIRRGSRQWRKCCGRDAEFRRTCCAPSTINCHSLPWGTAMSAYAWCCAVKNAAATRTAASSLRLPAFQCPRHRVQRGHQEAQEHRRHREYRPVRGVPLGCDQADRASEQRQATSPVSQTNPRVPPWRRHSRYPARGKIAATSAAQPQYNQ